MPDTNISLLREKFVLNDWKTSLITAHSNRIVLDIPGAHTTTTRHVIRTQNMWSCIRMAAQLLRHFKDTKTAENKGPDWEILWKSAALNSYDYQYNTALWGAVYSRGKPIFTKGKRHDFLDIIEGCAFKNEGAYDNTIPYVETVFEKAGKPVQIDYDANIGLILHLEEDTARFGLMYRNKGKSRNYQVQVAAKTGRKSIDQTEVMNGCAAFLEGIQLSYKIAQGNRMIRRKARNFDSAAHKKYEAAQKRLNEIQREIRELEASHQVRYRPEKPDFDQVIFQAGG